jgi:MerR family transcriptional regulator, Zn(II)-responsive regulator of zntA
MLPFPQEIRVFSQMMPALDPDTDVIVYTKDTCTAIRKGEGIVRISEVSRRTGVSIRSLRYYEQKRLLCPRRLSNGYRDLDEQAVQRVHMIQMYLGLGLTTEQIEEILQCDESAPLPQPLPVCEEALLALYQEKQQDIEHQIQVLTALHSRLTERIACLQRQLQTA